MSLFSHLRGYANTQHCFMQAKEIKKSPVKRQNLQVTGNYDVLTTIDELQESQKKAQMLTEQDIKVEQSKEIRNTLESFIYDNRSKVLS